MASYCGLYPNPNPNPNPNSLLWSSTCLHCFPSAPRSSFSSSRNSIPSPSPSPSPSSVVACQQSDPTWTATVQNGKDTLEICRVVNGMWQTSGGWGKIDPKLAVDSMLRYLDEGFFTFDMADHYGPAEDLYGLFINRVRRERGDELAYNVKGLTKWVPPPVKMTRAYVEGNIDKSRKRMDVKTLDMLQFHWWDYSNKGYLDALKHLTDLKEEECIFCDYRENQDISFD